MINEHINYPLIRPISQGQESPGSLLLRYSELNGWRSPNRFLNEFNIKHKLYSIFIDENKWSLVSSKLGISKETKNSIFYKKNKKDNRLSFKFINNYIPLKDLNVKSPVICPLCIELNNYIPKLWDHKLISFCSVHNIILLDKCEKCDKKISWDRLGLNKCCCGFKYIESKLVKINLSYLKFIEKVIIANDEALLLILSNYYDTFEQFYKFIGVKVSNTKLSEFSVLAYIKHCKIEDIILKETCRMAKSKGYHPRIVLHVFLISKTPEINTFGIEILSEFDLYIDLYIKNTSKFDEIYTLNQKATKIILGIQDYSLKNLVESNHLKKIKSSICLQSINDYLILFLTKMPKRYSSKSIGSIISNQNYKNQANILKLNKKSELFFKEISEHYTTRMLSVILDTFEENIVFLIEQGIIKTCNGKNNKTYYIERKEVLRVKQKLVFENQVSKEFDECPEVFYKKFKILGVLPLSGPKVDKAIIYVYKREDLHGIDLDMFKKLNINYQKKQIDISNLETDHIYASTILEKLDITHETLESLFFDKLLIRKKKKPKSDLLLSLTRYSYPIEPLISLCNEINRSRIVSIDEAAKIVGTTKDLFYWEWVNNGRIKNYNNGSSLFYSRESINKILEFKRSYVRTTYACKLINKDYNYIKSLEKLKILTPLKITKSYYESIVFYDKKDIMQLKENIINLF